MRINNLGYLLKEGIRGIFLHGLMSFAAVCVTVACLLIVGSFSCLMYNVNIMAEELNKTNEVLVYIDEDLSEPEAQQITTEIGRIRNVWLTTFVSREEALDKFIEDHGGSESLSGVDASLLRHRIVVTLEDNSLMRATVEQIETIEGVAKITAPYEMAEGFATVQEMLQLLSVAVIAILLVISLLIISNTVKIAMYDRRDEIAIMKMVGATNGFIRLPFVVEGFILGMLGAGIAFGLQWLLYDALLGRIAIIDTLKLITLVPFRQLLEPIAITFAAAGMFVGIVGSWNSIRKFMNV
ncbi:MAG: permease-like cell division protein FtsX [Oscillospiraceae bacterium]|nr:permease-like cell division protein FtsX [Oscillospiraceae bacterium]